MHVIEFVGPAGSGKTTIVNTLSSAYFTRGEVYNVFSILWLFWSPRILFRSIMFLWRSGGVKSFSKCGLNWLFVIGALIRAEYIARSSRKVVVFDQLTLQALRWCARHFGTSVSKIVKLGYEYLYTSDSIVIVNAPHSLVYQRLKGRGDSVIGPIDPVNFWKSCLDTRRAVGFLKIKKGVSFTILNSTESIQVSKKKVFDFVFNCHK